MEFRLVEMSVRVIDISLLKKVETYEKRPVKIDPLVRSSPFSTPEQTVLVGQTRQCPRVSDQKFASTRRPVFEDWTNTDSVSPSRFQTQHTGAERSLLAEDSGIY